MLPKAEKACFAIADISGYTHFVSGVELDHAQDIIADIMDTLVRALRPPFRLAKFEGDAAFVYALADKVDGSLLQDSIEQAYFAFRKRLRSIKQASSCECQACSRMQSLDVKFVVHHGEFIRQKMAGREELAGRDVILVHRLLKNDVGKTFGPHAYALFSDACVQAMGIDPAAQGHLEHAEAIEHIGETKCWVSDLEEAWTRETETARTLVPRTGAYMLIERDFAAPRQALWDLVTSPQHHARWQRSDGVVENNAQGRRGAGTQNHCLHGKDAVIEDIVDWRPFDYATLTALLPIPGPENFVLLYIRGPRRRRRPLRIPRREAEAEGSALSRARKAHDRSELYGGVRYPAVNGDGTTGVFDDRRRAASAGLARTLRDPAAPRALASAGEATRQSAFDTKQALRKRQIAAAPNASRQC
jgi:hypothetical protein